MIVRSLLYAVLVLLLASCGDDGASRDVSNIPSTDLDSLIASRISSADMAPDVSALPSISDPKARLGRALFFARSLSGDGDVACVSCHHPLLAGADGLSLSVGVQPRQAFKLGPGRLMMPSELDLVAGDGPNVPRNAPTTFNIGLYDRVMFHDGRLFVLDEAHRPNGAGQAQRTPDSFQNVADANAGANLTITQAGFPVTSLFEMRGYGAFTNLDNPSTRNAIAGRLQADPDWLGAFRNAFARPSASAQEVVTFPNIAEALAEYQRSQVLVDNPWFRYLKGDKAAVGESVKRGAILFYTPVKDGGAGCASCHAGSHFTDESFRVSGFPQIGRGKNTAQQDFGRFEVTQSEADRYAFRVPSLLNVARTAPYGHAGTFDTLEDLLRYHVNPEAGALAFDYSLQHLRQYKGLSVRYPNARSNTLLAVEKFKTAPGRELLYNPALTEEGVAYLADFLRSLTDPCLDDAACMSPWIAAAATDDKDGTMLTACFDQVVLSGHPCGSDAPVPEPEAPEEVPEAANPGTVENAVAKAAMVALLGSCSNTVATAPNSGQNRFTMLPSSQSGITHKHGYADSNWISNLSRIEYYMVNGSVAAGYLNADCWPDLLFPAGDAGNRVYLGKGDMSFTSSTGLLPDDVFASAAIADLDGDYRQDVILGPYARPGNVSSVSFFRNEWPVLSPVADAGVSFRRNTSSITVGDYNRDGWPDIVTALWTVFINASVDNHLWKNLGGFRFYAVDGSVGLKGISNAVDHSFSPAFTDVNDDGLTDLLMVGDFENSHVFMQGSRGGFAKVTNRSVISDENGMGSAVGDFDGDGDMDWFVSSVYTRNPPKGNWGMSGNRLYRNDAGVFADATEYSGVRDGGWGWGSCAADFDNDGDLDIFQVNGYGMPEMVWKFWSELIHAAGDPPYLEFLGSRARLFINDGSGRFVESAESWHIADTRGGRGISCLDADRDGDVDVVIANNSRSPSVYRNESGAGAGRHFLSVRLVGNAPGTEALGARIYVQTGARRQVREVGLNTNYLSNNPLEQHFGLGSSAMVDSVRVVWPRTGKETVLRNVAAGQFLVIAEP